MLKGRFMNKDKDIKKEDEIDLREISMIFIKRKWWFIGSVLAVLIIGLLYVFIQPTNYLLTYQIEVSKNYSNNDLSELYPNYEEELNYICLENVPVIFKSEYIFRSLNEIDKDVDYNKLLKSESVKIVLNENTSIFDVSVSNSDYDLADKIAKTLIDTFDNLIRNREEIIFNEVLGKIELDIKDLENENDNYESTIIAGLEGEVDSLYAELNRYIVDYNVGLSDELEKNKNSENVSFYNVIIPPNDINDEILTLQKEIDLYRGKILENKSKIIDLNNLYENLLKDEDIILDRVNLVSEDPFYEIESNRLRNVAIILVLCVIIGIIVTFGVNFLINLKVKENRGKNRLNKS
jgi:capsular polysaccharide biosynthesis protein